MSLTSSEMTPADIAAVTNNGNCNGNGWGGDWNSWIILFLIFGMFGWGGFGGFGGFGGNAGMNGMLTRADLCQDMNFQQLENGVRGIQQGICDSTYALNNSINGLGTTVMQGFHGVDNGLCTLGYQTQQGFNGVNNAICSLGYQNQQGFNNLGMAYMQGQNAIQTQLSDCCCKNQTGQLQLGNQIERGFCDVNYAQATNTNAIIQSGHNDTDRLLARLDAMENSRKDEKIAEQAAQIQALQFAASQSNQNAVLMAAMDANTASIIRRTGNDCPVPAYVVQPPSPVSFATNCRGQAAFGNNGGGYCCNGCNG